MEQQKTEAEINQLIEQIKKITRKDGDKEYVVAQFNLASIYYFYKKDLQQAIDHLLNIKKQDNPEIYAQAQFNLGVIYLENLKNKDQAAQFYSNVEEQDNPEVFNSAQCNLGYIHQNLNYNFELAIQCYSNVKEKYNLDIYARTQFNLGLIYQSEYNDFGLAEECYKKIKEEYNPEVYANAQLNLGFIYQKEHKNFEEAKSFYLEVKKEDNPKVYVNAQLNLGIIYQYVDKEFDDAENCYSNNIEKQYDSKVYARAQYFLGLLYQDVKQDIKQAERYYLKVEKQDNPDVYAEAQIKLGDNVFFSKTSNELKLAEEYYQNVTYSDDSFKSYIIAQIMLSLISSNNSSTFTEKQRDKLVINPICKIRKLVREIQNELFVTFRLNRNLKTQKQQFERQVAHYTKPEVLFNLLKNESSDFRLNVIDFMNDPTENQILTDWLRINTENNNEIKTFLASFSFNHNSLNQFRLYGNENNIVGSSVSVVFSQEFFSKNIKPTINSEGINSLFKYENLCSQQSDSANKVVAPMQINVPNENLIQKSNKTRNDSKENSAQKNSALVAEKNITSSVGLLPLFRCLYFDPKSSYISIAKRNKFSFYLEHQKDSAKNIDKKWNNYLKSLKEKKKIITIRNKLNQIQNIICRLKKSRKLKEITNLDQLIALALMPISCLVKHAAFEDEDECRMIYITNIDDKNIQTPNEYAFINRLYLNYSNVKGYIEKIYLGPRCQSDPELWITNRAQTLKSNLTNEPIKVMKSQMPLR